MLRRTKGEVGLDLPPKKEVLIYAPSTLTQQALYETAINLIKDGKVL
jgi:SNF2 family DNA or RNA helicase